VHFAGPDKFSAVKRDIELAMQLSKGRVLEDPRILLCRHVLRVPFPHDQVAPAASTISRYLDAVRRARTLDQLLHGGVPYRGKRLQIGGFSVVADLMENVKRQWVAAIETMATDTYPDWRTLFQQSGWRWRLPAEKRKELEPITAWQDQRVLFIKGLLEWLQAKMNPQIVDEMCIRLDALLEFAIFVTREFLLRNYSVEKHGSDVFDQFQLQYLAMREYVIVSGDADLPLRTQRSTQAQRIMSFAQFLRML
jgi:hypothetical protein